MENKSINEKIPPGLTLRQILRGHTDSVFRMEWSPDGQFLASPSFDETICIWESKNGTLVNRIKGGEFTHLAWSPDSKMIAASPHSNKINIYRAKTGKTVNTLKANGSSLWFISWSPDGSDLVAGEYSGDICYKWNLKKNESYHVLKEDNYALESAACKWLYNGSLIAVGGSNDNVFIFDSKSEKLIQKLKGPSGIGEVRSIDWSPVQKKNLAVAVGESTNKIRIWNVKTGQHLKDIEGHTEDLYCVSYSFDGRLLCSKGTNYVRIWRCDTFETIAKIKEPTDGTWPPGVAFHPKEPILATCGEEPNEIRIWDLDIKLLLKNMPVEKHIQYTNAKVVLVGETGTGKTCVARALMGEPYEPQESTHGIKVWKLHAETVKQNMGQEIIRETMLWDLAGQTDYQVVHQLFLEQTALGIVLFDPSHPDHPFAGVGFWEKALNRVAGTDCPRLLIAGRIDRGFPTATQKDIDVFIKEHNYVNYIATSAKTNAGIGDLRKAIYRFVPWNKFPVTSSPELWKTIRKYLIDRRKRKYVLTRCTDLQESFKQKYKKIKFSSEEFNTVISHAQIQGIVWRLSFGDFILLKPEILNDYAAAIVRVARKQDQGLGCVCEQNVLDAHIDFEDLPRIDNLATEQSLLYAVVQLLLNHELALRETGQLVFPSKFNRQRPVIPKPQPRVEAYQFEGQVEQIYATLVVRLFYSGAFKLKDLWKNAAEFHDSLDCLCLFVLDKSIEGKGIISVSFHASTQVTSKLLFIQFIHEHLEKKALKNSVKRERIYRCLQCGEEVQNKRAVESRLKKPEKTITCQFCDTRIELNDELEKRLASTELSKQLREMDATVEERKNEEVGIIVAKAKDSIDEFDVFLAHNSVDKDCVQAVAHALRLRGLNPWFDIEQVPPGRWFQNIIKKTILTTKSAAIFLGKQGIGRWQIVELRSFISQCVECVERTIPIIPVLLPGVIEIPGNLIFLKQYTRVVFEKECTEKKALDNLQWGITGKRPKSLRSENVDWI